MERYSSYKDSNVSWIGEIPSHWKLPSIGRLFEIKAGGDAKPELYSYEKDTDHPYPVYTNTKDPKSVYAYTTTPIFEANTITVTGRGEIGRAIFRGVPYDAIIRLLSLRPKIKLCPKFYAYFIDVVIPFTSDSAAIGQLSAVQIKPKSVTLPPLAEQEKIVSYLESKTSKLDAYVADKEKEIQLLQELKQKTIAEAVTKGLNSNVKMKDSGISWIGMIPDHWEIKKIGSLFTERREKVSDKDFPALSVSKQGITPQLETAVKTDNGDNRKKVCKDDFVVNSRSDRKGSCGVSPYTGSVSLINIVLSPRNNIEVQYFHHLFRSNDYIEEYYRIGRGIVADLWTTRYSEMRNIMVPLPPLDEQQAIVSYIEEKCQKIDTLITELQAEIDYLKEYKQRLIADVVTGQVDVQNEMI